MSDSIKILLAEDEPSLALIIKESLETRNFQVIVCADGQQALQQYREEAPQLLVLDVMMPKTDGFALAREIRAADTKTPIIFLTAKSQTKDVVEGFHYGGNDYLKKPFSMEELIVRIYALLNRVGGSALQEPDQEIAIGSYRFDPTRQTLTCGPASVPLTHRETQVLRHLYQNRNQMVTRSFILTEIWGQDDFFSGRSLDVFISKLRRKLSADPRVQIINSRGFGYKLIC